MTRPVLRRLVIGGAVLACLFLLVLGALPVRFARGFVADRLSAQLGRPVTIGSMARAEAFSFTPTILLRGIRIPQPDWAGGGALVSLREARVRVPMFPLLVGQLSPRAIALDGGRITLVRAKDGRESWSKDAGGQGGSDGGLRLEQLELRDTVLTYRDAKQDRSLTLRLEARPKIGLLAAGSGAVHGTPVRATLRGGRIVAGERWPFYAQLAGPALRFAAKGSMAHALDTADMRLHVETRAADLQLIDALIEAGLFGSQPVRLTADVRRADQRWEVERIGGSIGRSHFSGTVTVAEGGPRKRLEGELVADRLDFDDLASDAGLAEAAAKERRVGPRLIPNSRIDLSRMLDLDGTLRFTVKRLLWKGQSPFRAGSGTLTLDHGRLELAPLRVALSRGRMTGTAVVDQRDGGPVPTLTADLRVDDSTLKSFVPTAPMDGRFQARVHLRGSGATVRSAIAHADGYIGMVARDGPMPAKLASFLGLDVARGALTDEDQQARLRCLVMRLDVRNGLGRGNPILIDTSRSQSRVTGTVRFGPEALAMDITGAPKQDSLLRLEAPVRVTGTIKQPEIDIPPRVKTVGNVLKMLGRAIGGKQKPLAQDADCGALAQRALAAKPAG